MLLLMKVYLRASSKSFPPPPPGGMTCSVQYKILIRSGFRIEIFEDKINL